MSIEMEYVALLPNISEETEACAVFLRTTDRTKYFQISASGILRTVTLLPKNMKEYFITSLVEKLVSDSGLIMTSVEIIPSDTAGYSFANLNLAEKDDLLQQTKRTYKITVEHAIWLHYSCNVPLFLDTAYQSLLLKTDSVLPSLKEVLMSEITDDPKIIDIMDLMGNIDEADPTDSSGDT